MVSAQERLHCWRWLGVWIVVSCGWRNTQVVGVGKWGDWFRSDRGAGKERAGVLCLSEDVGRTLVEFWTSGLNCAMGLRGIVICKWLWRRFARDFRWWISWFMRRGVVAYEELGSGEGLVWGAASAVCVVNCVFLIWSRGL